MPVLFADNYLRDEQETFPLGRTYYQSAHKLSRNLKHLQGVTCVDFKPVLL